MKTRALGRSPVAVTALGFGGAPIGNLYHAVDDATAAAAVTAAFQAGVRLFDTAPHYGLGLWEARLGPDAPVPPAGEGLTGEAP